MPLRDVDWKSSLTPEQFEFFGNLNLLVIDFAKTALHVRIYIIIKNNGFCGTRKKTRDLNHT